MPHRSEKLGEVETTARRLDSLDSQVESGQAELPDSAGGRSASEVCVSLMRLDRNEVLLCKRICEHGLEYAVIDHSPAASAYARAFGPLDMLHTGDNPRQVLRDYVQGESETLQMMANDITANVRLLISERFPKQDLRDVVNEITTFCRRAARLAVTEMLKEHTAQTHKFQRGVHA